MTPEEKAEAIELAEQVLKTHKKQPIEGAGREECVKCLTPFPCQARWRAAWIIAMATEERRA